MDRATFSETRVSGLGDPHVSKRVWSMKELGIVGASWWASEPMEMALAMGSVCSDVKEERRRIPAKSRSVFTSGMA